MTEGQKWIKLVSLAGQGRGECMSELARQAQGRLRAYIYRVTLDHDLTDDLAQETLLQMVKSLEDLKEPEHFWPWIYRVAQSKIQQHFKTMQRKKALDESAFYEDFVSRHDKCAQDEGQHKLIREELSRKVLIAMNQLKRKYRAVLALRCYEQLPYSDIAIALQCKETVARVLFFRAKQALKRQLGRQGLSKSLMLMSLGLFGRMTAPAETASSTFTVTAASTEVGLATAVLATAGSKLGIAAVTAAAVVALAAGTSIRPGPAPPAPVPSAGLPARDEVRSMHFTAQLLNNDPCAGGSLSKGAYEQWYSFPDGIDGPMLMRMQRWDVQQQNKQCSWLQDGRANYYFDSGTNTVHISNYRVFWSSLEVWRLPTDSQEFIDFLEQAEGKMQGFHKYCRDGQTGLLKSSVDFRFANAPNFRTDYDYNSTACEQFAYKLPADYTIVDERDPMHKRGWTYFRIEGEMNGRAIAGAGCLPFVYDAIAEHPAWMAMNVGKNLEIIDGGRGGCVRDGDGTLAAYPAGSFSAGLSRPWMGMHTINLIRRDAAEQRLWFRTRHAENDTNATVTIFHTEEGDVIKLTYIIDLENDLIREIRFEVRDEAAGMLIFSYLEDIDRLGGGFTEPVISGIQKCPAQRPPGILWLINLVRGDLGK